VDTRLGAHPNPHLRLLERSNTLYRNVSITSSPQSAGTAYCSGDACNATGPFLPVEDRAYCIATEYGDIASILQTPPYASGRLR